MTTHPHCPRRRLTAGALAFVAVVGSATACASSGSKSGTSNTSATTNTLTSLAQQLVNDGAPGVIVRVDDGHGSTIQVARQAAWTVPDHVLTPDDQFRMGSNTKTMVAALVLQLVAAHTLSLDDSAQKWLPGMIPNGSAPITIRMLLNHTSGLFNYVDDPRIVKVLTGQDTRIWTPQELLAVAVSHPPLFAPGAEYSYSNTNYVALGLILEKATGQSLANLIQDRIAKPLGLTGTYLAPDTPDPADTRLADGYEPDAAILAPLLPPYAPAGTSFAGPARGDYVNTTWDNVSANWAAGGIVSTAADWARFQSALVSGKLIPQAQVKELETTVSEGSGTQDRYGLGFEHKATPCGTVWGHDGQAAGYSTWNYTDDTGTRTVAVFVTTIFGLAKPKTSVASQTLLDAAVCAMLDKPIPASAG